MKSYKDALKALYINRKLSIYQKEAKEFEKKVLKSDPSLKNKAEGEDKWLQKWSVFGVKINPIYYRFFSKFIGYTADIVPPNISHLFIEPVLNDVRFQEYYGNKNHLSRILPQDVMPKTFLRKISGVYYNAQYDILEEKEETILNNILNNVDEFIIKPTLNSETRSGHGVRLFTKVNDSFLDSNGTCFTAKLLKDCYSDDFIIQERIHQADFFEQLNKTSLNTIRVVTYRSVKDNKIHVLHSVLKIGKAGLVIDNDYGRFVGVHEDGTLMDYVVAYRKGIKETCYNGLDFASNKFKIPCYQQIKDFAKNIAKNFPQHRLISFDIAVDNNNKLLLIEPNLWVGSYFLEYYQYTIDSGYGRFTDEIIEYAINNMNQNPILLKL